MSNLLLNSTEKSVADLTLSSFGADVNVACRITKANGAKWDSGKIVPLNTGTLANKIAQVKEILPASATLVWASLAHPLDAPEPGVVAEEFESCMERTIGEGSALFTELSDNGLATILKKLNEMPDGSRLTINTDCAFFPWEILYPLDYSKDFPQPTKDANPPRRELLWGYRFIIDYNLLPTGAEGWEPPISAHENGPAFVSINLNPTIDKAFKGKPFQPIQFHQDFYDKRIGATAGEIWKAGTDIYKELLSMNNQATVIYLYCHGSSSVPFSPSIAEQLELDDTTSIKPSSLNLPNVYERGPIVILNSCSSGSQSPLSFSSFHSTFRKKGAMGIIGTSIPIPATFAAAFGTRLIQDYLDGIPIGIAIYGLRRELVLKNNPLALFYSLQCPIYVTAPKVEEQTL
jgi:hypothetical protein